ncbi:MAG: amidase family protein, partial [Flavobacteriia bacterium]
MYRSFAEVKTALASGETVLDIVNGYIETIRQHSDLNAFLEVFDDSAKQQAKLVDQKRLNGEAGRLAGMVIGIKDN